MSRRRRRRACIRIPEPYSSRIDALMRDDEEVFLQHPGLKAFARDPVPGEFFPQHLDARAVVVVRLGPGLRVRTPMDLTPEQCTAPGVLDWITARFGCPCGGRP